VEAAVNDQCGADHATFAGPHNHRSVRQLADRGEEGPLASSADQPIRMELLIEIRGADPVSFDPVRIAGHPRSREIPKSFPLAFEAGPVAGGQGSRLIEEEEFGVFAGGHQLPLPSIELGQAVDPALADVMSNDLLVIVMEAAAIAHELPARAVGNQFPEGVDPVLPGSIPAGCPGTTHTHP